MDCKCSIGKLSGLSMAFSNPDIPEIPPSDPVLVLGLDVERSSELDLLLVPRSERDDLDP